MIRHLVLQAGILFYKLRLQLYPAELRARGLSFVSFFPHVLSSVFFSRQSHVHQFLL